MASKPAGRGLIQGVVFDMDGLMFDTEQLSVRAWEQTSRQLGIPIDREFIVATLGLNLRNSQRVFQTKLGASFDYLHARQIKLAYVTAQIEAQGMPLKAGLLELLDYLRDNRYRMTVATSNEADRTRYYLDKAGIAGYFDRIVTGDMIERGKPAPDIYLKACELIDTAPAACLALEDSPPGIRSASQAGLKAVMIPDLAQPTEEINRLLFARLNNLREVIQLLEEP